jgi:CHASE2 domain-containing sensor protein
MTGATLGMRHLGWLEFMELAAYDHFMQQQPDRGPDDRLLVVGITETDLQTLQEWPVSDRSLALALANLQKLEPAVVAVDILRDFPQEPGYADLMQQFRQHANVIATCKTSSLDDLGTPPPPTVSPDQVGFADLVIDPGGILRRSLLLVTPPQPSTPFPKQHFCNDFSQTLLSFGFRSVLLYLQKQGVEAGFTEAGELKLGNTIIPAITSNTGGYRNADTAGYQVLLHFRSETNGVKQVSLTEVLEERVEPGLVRDRIVMIGYTTPQSKDDFYTPFSSARDDRQKMPGVVVHAQSASQLLSTVLDGQPLIWVWPTSLELIWILGWSLAGGILGWYLRHPAAFALVIVLGAGGLYVMGLVIFLGNGWIPVVPPALTFVGTAVGVVLLDRFNNSTYGQQVYRKVKTLLHLDIDIDEEKLEKQVSEITETDYFRDLQDKVKTLRDGSDAGEQTQPTFEQHVPSWSGFSGTPASNSFSTLSEAGMDDLDRLLAPQSPTATQHHTAPTADEDELVRLLAPQTATAAPSSAPALATAELNYLDQINQKLQVLRPTPPTAKPEDNDGLGFLDTLNQEAQQLKHQLQGKATAPLLSTFAMDDVFCRCQDTSEATAAYIQFIDQEIQALKQQIQHLG